MGPFAAVALLAGMFTTQTIAKMKNVFEVVMTPEEKGADSLESGVFQVTSLEPTSGAVGARITVSGTGLDAVTRVVFRDDVEAAFSVDGDRLIVLVPAAATTGVVTVWRDQRFAESPQPFTVR